MAVFILVLGPLSLTVVNYGVTFMFAAITLHQMFDKEIDTQSNDLVEECPASENDNNTCDAERNNEGEKSNEKCKDNEQDDNEDETTPVTSSDDCNVCSESRIYTIFSNLREKFSFSENL